MQNRDAILGRLWSEINQWLELFATAPAGRLVEPGVNGDQSCKDVLAHVTAYARWNLEWLRAARRAELPPPSYLVDGDLDGRNARLLAEVRPLPLETVLEEAGRVLLDLFAEVEGLSTAELTDPQILAPFVLPYWKQALPVWQCVANDTYEHFHEHYPALRRWLGAPALTLRTAQAPDLPALAELRWRFRTEWDPHPPEQEKPAYLEVILPFLQAGLENGRWVYWVAEAGGQVLANAFVERVEKVPRPGALHAAFGYVTNVFTLPGWRGRGIGAQLLERVKAWAEAEGLEFLILWPAELSIPFYQSQGFTDPAEAMLYTIT